MCSFPLRLDNSGAADRPGRTFSSYSYRHSKGTGQSDDDGVLVDHAQLLMMKVMMERIHSGWISSFVICESAHFCTSVNGRLESFIWPIQIERQHIEREKEKKNGVVI